MKIKKLICDLQTTIDKKKIEIQNKTSREDYVNSHEHGIDKGYILLGSDVLLILKTEHTDGS